MIKIYFLGKISLKLDFNQGKKIICLWKNEIRLEIQREAS